MLTSSMQLPAWTPMLPSSDYLSPGHVAMTEVGVQPNQSLSQDSMCSSSGYTPTHLHITPSAGDASGYLWLPLILRLFLLAALFSLNCKSASVADYLFPSRFLPLSREAPLITIWRLYLWPLRQINTIMAKCCHFPLTARPMYSLFLWPSGLRISLRRPHCCYSMLIWFAPWWKTPQRCYRSIVIVNSDWGINMTPFFHGSWYAHCCTFSYSLSMLM